MTFRFGRKRPAPERAERQPKFKTFRTAAPLVIPDGFDYGALCLPALQTMLANGPDPTAPSQIVATGVGCCTCAAPGHGIDILTAGAGAPVTITSKQVVTLYSLSCGYVLGDESTDLGGDELTVLDYIQAHGIDGNGLHQFAGTATLDATNLTEMKEALFVAGWLPLCAELPNAYTNPMPAPDAVWDMAGPPNPQQGHCFLATKFTPNGPGPGGKPCWGVDTWGMIVWFTAEACAYYCATAQGGSANLALSKEWLSASQGKAPNQLDWAGLTSVFQQQLGGTVTT
jgi:hypothetical protein